jgi:hypothetical protein
MAGTKARRLTAPADVHRISTPAMLRDRRIDAIAAGWQNGLTMGEAAIHSFRGKLDCIDSADNDEAWNRV